MFEFLWNLSSFIVALGVLITVHEYGHFWVARKNGVKVERFSIGFGTPLWRTFDKHGTEYVVAMIPLGGYVKMLDERVDQVSEADKPYTFNSKSVYQRIAIIGAGPFANFAFALFAFYLMFLIGVPSVKPIIGNIEQNSISQLAGITPGGEIVAIDGQATRDWTEVNLALASAIGDDKVEISVKPKDSVSARKFILELHQWQFSPDKESAIESLGFVPFAAKRLNELAVVGEQSAAEKGGLKAGDKLLSINGINTQGSWDVFSKQIKQLAKQEVEIKVQRSSETLILTVIPDEIERDGEKIGYLGVGPKIEPYPESYLIDRTYGPIDAIGQSIDKTWSMVKLTFEMIGKLITGDVSVKNLAGPISIAQGAGAHANYGVAYFLGFMALISINLGIINILPIPVLDGGHLVYYLIELFTGKPVPEKIQEIGFKFGTLVLLGLMTIALLNDFSRL